MANTVDPDETAHYEPSHLDLQCLQIQQLLCLALYGLKPCFFPYAHSKGSIQPRLPTVYSTPCLDSIITNFHFHNFNVVASIRKLRRFKISDGVSPK